MNLIEFFAGISGFGLGFERAGFKPVLQVEIDDNCRELLGHKFPGAIQISDVRQIAAVWRRLRLNKPICEKEKWLLIFGFKRIAPMRSPIPAQAGARTADRFRWCIPSVASLRENVSGCRAFLMTGPKALAIRCAIECLATPSLCRSLSGLQRG